MYRHIKILLVLVFYVLHPVSTMAANKCIGADGKISFQDTPCSNTSRSAEVLKLRPDGNTLSGAASYGISPLDLSGPPEVLSLRILATFEALASSSTDCRIKLDVYGPSPEAQQVCGGFVAHHRAWWTPAIEAQKSLLKNQEWTTKNLPIMERSTRAMQKTAANAEYISMKIQTQSR